MKVVMEFEIDEDELDEFIEEHGDVYEWAFAEICQNWGFGFLTGVQKIDE